MTKMTREQMNRAIAYQGEEGCNWTTARQHVLDEQDFLDYMGRRGGVTPAGPSDEMSPQEEQTADKLYHHLCANYGYGPAPKGPAPKLTHDESQMFDRWHWYFQKKYKLGRRRAPNRNAPRSPAVHLSRWAMHEALAYAAAKDCDWETARSFVLYGKAA